MRRSTAALASALAVGAAGLAPSASGAPPAGLAFGVPRIVEASAAGTLRYYGGRTATVDLCSVSGCKPNYLTYNAAPFPGVLSGTGTADGRTLTIHVPATALGNPGSSSLLEEAMAFVVASPQSGVVPQNNGTSFADIAPLQLEGTKTVNVRFGSPSALRVVAPALTGGHAPVAGGALPRTGLSAAIPAGAVLALLGGLLMARRRPRTL